MNGAANYPLNCWYVVAISDEVGAGLLAREVLDRRIVLFRKGDGTIGALEDRCAHRGAPLSMGSVADDTVVCAYHGFAYGSDGRCVRVPSQQHVPYGAKVRSFPVREDAPFVWVWLGQPGLVRASQPPVVRQLRDAGWTTQGGTSQVGANYLLLHDIALDRTHFAYVHPHRIHRGYIEDPSPLQVEVTETTVSYSRMFARGPLTEWQCTATGLAADGEYAQRESGTFVSPALHVDEMEILGPDGAIYRAVFIRAYTPVDPSTTRIVWRAARNYALDDESVTERLREVYEGTMMEDQPILEAIQAGVTDTGVPVGHAVSAAADAPTIRAYRIVGAMLAEERGRAARPRPH
jgi:phenylpropionate dioxygenase-like ring-hydroxylating dioxygenase large terminal subunit